MNIMMLSILTVFVNLSINLKLEQALQVSVFTGEWKIDGTSDRVQKYFFFKHQLYQQKTYLRSVD